MFNQTILAFKVAFMKQVHSGIKGKNYGLLGVLILIQILSAIFLMVTKREKLELKEMKD